MDPVKDIAELLTSRREKVTPDQVGLPTYGPRRVKGLRREGGRLLSRARRVVGELELSYEVMELSADAGLTVSVYSAEPDSRSHQALDRQPTREDPRPCLLRQPLT